ncbi:hypothetical protein CJF30_00002605 [Rutstroemia sp. NJR-2017a BBW]|nr:hypothetical protein CJF30_00002605 [Rutstroemia sp. NJR-2017a BBW]
MRRSTVQQIHTGQDGKRSNMHSYSATHTHPPHLTSLAPSPRQQILLEIHHIQGTPRPMDLTGLITSQSSTIARTC